SPRPPGASGESRYTYAHGPASDDLRESGILSDVPKHGRLLPTDDATSQIPPCAAAWGQTRRGICSPILNGIGSDKGLTLHPPLRWVLIKPPWRRMLLSSTVKPFRVSLVEPVAYLSDS